MEERIKARIVALQQAARETEMRLVALQNMIAELEALLLPESPIISGDSLGGAG